MNMRIVYYPFFLCCLPSCCMSDDYQNPVVDSDHPDPGALALPDGLWTVHNQIEIGQRLYIVRVAKHDLCEFNSN